jgi:predicted RNA-binding Zn-ribbon protein involved in translation (DUF1610 family)
MLKELTMAIRSTFNNGKHYHGSEQVMEGRLKGQTDNSDYFYFICPKCPDEIILRILEYGEHAREEKNPYNNQTKSKAKYGFTLAFKLYCEKCGFRDFVKISNTGWQGGSVKEAMYRS